MPTVTFIGAGNLATRLGIALAGKGYRVKGVYSRTRASATALAATLRAAPATSLDTLEEADYCVFCVKDDALAGLAREWGSRHPRSFCLHTAGSMPLSVFDGHVESYGVLYPLQTFTKTRAVDFGQVPCFVEGSNPEALGRLTRLARDLGGPVVELPSERRRWMHLAAVFACNFTNHCYDIAARLLREAGVPPALMHPLIGETAAKARELGPRGAQTGPAVRYDQGVIGKHLSLLEGDPQLQRIYRLLSEHIHQYAQGK